MPGCLGPKKDEWAAVLSDLGYLSVKFSQEFRKGKHSLQSRLGAGVGGFLGPSRMEIKG